ncbi:xylose repressor XylR [Hydrogenispora ethanolica]|uniref:Xylose repressor XylR n=1 Tax=Hydrogenispora ethanolica TaxID=1082276 RepID=A0A4R1RIN2_HYDET|nr:ROK family transcriptional regulator [Hydrogenispora ethanolica]TCL65965.1 xylose repressor XylR [Hydrogenispora ethanolica]
MRKAINQERMRSINKRQVFSCVKNHGPVSKKEIAELLGTSLTTVSTFINELIEEHKLTPSGTSKSTGGRKSEIFTLNPDALYCLGIDLQVDRLVSVVLNFNGEPVAGDSVPFQAPDEWEVAAAIRATIRDAVAQAGIDPAKLAHIGIGIPGIVDPDSCIVEFAPNLEWRNVNLRQLLALDQPLLIENEANAAALGEKVYGAGRLSANLCFISVGIGIGAGLILNNGLYRGASHHAGEFGHMTLDPDGPACRCGNHGCWEVFASNEAALKQYWHRTGRKLASYDHLLALAAAADPDAGAVLEEIATYLGIGIAGIVNGINPELVVVGGKIATCGEMLRNRLLKEIKERTLERTFRGLTVEFSSLGDRATALGVAEMALDRMV